MARQQADNQALATKLDVLTDEQVALQDVLAGVMHQLSQVHLGLCIAPLYVLVPKRSASIVDVSSVESVTVITCLHRLMQARKRLTQNLRPGQSLTVKRYLVLTASSLCLTTCCANTGAPPFQRVSGIEPAVAAATRGGEPATPGIDRAAAAAASRGNVAKPTVGRAAAGEARAAG